MLQTIQELSHHTRTIFGQSERGYQSKSLIPIQGVGQGNGAGPQIWALVSTPILNMLRAKGLGAAFRSAITSDEILLGGYAFVDDTDLVTSQLNSNRGDQVASKMQESLSAWEGGLRATGGAIVPEKSHWYLIEFGWKNGNPFYKSVNETESVLQVRDHVGVIRTIRQWEPNHAERTLGVRLAPDGNMTAQFDHMLQVASNWAESLRLGNLPRHLTWQAWRTTILKTLEYPLPVTTLTRAQCNKLTSTIAAAALPRCGIVRSFPRALLHAPLKYGGLSIPDLYVEQGIAHILRLLRFSQSNSHSTGILIKHSCEAFKVNLGCNGRIFSLRLTLEPLATEGWIKHTWRFLQEHSITIQDDIPDFAPIREGDSLLIPLFSKLGNAGKELQLLNQCRLFLRVLWLSDISTGSGTNIETHAVKHPIRSTVIAALYFLIKEPPRKKLGNVGLEQSQLYVIQTHYA
jgi:hypothetical protein